jgi:hypothetical protein
VKAAALSWRLAWAACGPVWMRTAEKSAPKRGSMKSRRDPGSGWPPVGRPAMAGLARAGAALPGTARIALAARDGTRPASRALLADTGAGGRLTTWRATRLASCSAASWGLETLSPPGAAAAARIGKTGVCTRTGAATAWCSGARRA